MRLLTLLLAVLLGFAPLMSHGQRTYADESALNQGTWYKLSIVENGIYRLDASYLSSLGINTSSIDPRTIQIFGYGGGMVPQANSIERPDDMLENHIYVEGEGDGRMDASDYVLFYAEGPHGWTHNESANRYDHSFNLYTDTSYYFLRVGETTGKRIPDVPSEASKTYTPSAGHGLRFHESDQENLIKSGRLWMGEKFDLITSRGYSFFLPDVAPGGQIRVRISVAARSDVTTAFNLRTGNSLLGSMSINSVNIISNEATYYRRRTETYTVPASAISADSLRLLLDFQRANSNRSEGWLDWIEIDYDKAMDTRNANVSYLRLSDQIGPGEVAELLLKNGSNNYRIWDITEPDNIVNQTFTLTGTTMGFMDRTEKARTYAIFKGGYKTPVGSSSVPNQNLHDETPYDYLMVVYPTFMEAAQKLADFHQDHYGNTVKLVTPQQIYNEFSSGRQDVAAIRDYIKMHYDRSGGSHPSFVLFFGDGTYDYKNITKSPTRRNFIPSYQSRSSDSPTISYTSDDFFAMLDDSEGAWGEGTGPGDPYQVNQMDVAIGRLPVENLEEGHGVVDKIIEYVTNPEGFGDWRNRVVLVGDYKDGEGFTHISQADRLPPILSQYNTCMNVEKIYLDNYPVVRTAGGTRFPQAREAMLDQFRRGSLFVNYTGHGGEYAWSNAGILNLADIQGMKNGRRQPAVVTATCEFGRFDDHDRRSGAEIFVMRPDGGAIAMFTTVRLVYSSPNATMNQNMYHEAFKYNEEKKRMPTVGEIMQATKNRTFTGGQTTDINSRNFTLLGDPGLILAYPELKAEITTINQRAVDPNREDTLKSLSKVTMSGRIVDDRGIFQADFNGDMSVTAYDKPSKFVTRLAPFPFYWQTNRIFNGNVSVVNGEFTFEFVVPIDISYEDGSGKISLYFENGERDGTGCYDNMYIGGTDTTVEPDTEGPKVELFMFDEYWQDGGKTGPDPYLFAKLHDENGINTVSSGIGHEIIGILDGDEENVIILNDYYRAERDNYKKGTVYHQLSGLSEGLHTLKIRVWDVANNWAEATTSFVVVSDDKLEITEAKPFPNPLLASHDGVQFLVGFTQIERDFDIQIRVYDLGGKVVRVLDDSFFATGNYYRGLQWDGRTAQGFPVSDGFYVYEVTLTERETGIATRETGKLVMMTGQ